MNFILFKKELKKNSILFFIFCMILALYTSIIIAMFDPQAMSSIQAMSESMPELFAMFGMDSLETELLGFLIGYLFGFLYVMFPLIFICILVNKVLIRYIDRGTIAYLLATKNSRSKIIRTQIGVIVAELSILCSYLILLNYSLCEIMFKGELEIDKFLIVCLGMLGLWLFAASVCFLSGCIFSEGRKALAVGVGCNVGFILIQMLAKAGDKFANIKYITPYTLFDPEGLAKGNYEAIVSSISLYVIAGIFFVLAAYIFKKKDLCV